jgi:hypothetical protein
LIDSVLKKHLEKQGGPKPVEPSEVPEPDDFGAFGWLRGVRDRAVMLELRHKDGTSSSYGYAWLKKAKFDPSDGIMLDFSGETVRITGRNLNAENQPNVRLFAGIMRHRVPWIAEADGPMAMETPKGATIIERIDEK